MTKPGMFATIPVADLERDYGHGALNRSLGPGALTALGIGGIIGTGIFVLTGLAAAQHAGPAVVISFIVAGLGCIFAGLCYAEFASMVPVAGSAYAYSTRRSGSSPPGSSAGTWCSNTCSPPPPWRWGGPATA